MKEQPLVSVIIPVYNVERYLAQCLDSVINQTYPNLEIICVNDGSRDGSPDILRRYADEDAWIQVIDKANGGVSQARNDALDCARGEYIMFVDSDDWVEPDACENAVNAMREYDADIVMWSYVSETENRSSRKVIFPETTVFEKEESPGKAAPKICRGNGRGAFPPGAGGFPLPGLGKAVQAFPDSEKRAPDLSIWRRSEATRTAFSIWRFLERPTGWCIWQRTCIITAGTGLPRSRPGTTQGCMTSGRRSTTGWKPSSGQTSWAASMKPR